MLNHEKSKFLGNGSKDFDNKMKRQNETTKLQHHPYL